MKRAYLCLELGNQLTEINLKSLLTVLEKFICSSEQKLSLLDAKITLQLIENITVDHLDYTTNQGKDDMGRVMKILQSLIT